MCVDHDYPKESYLMICHNKIVPVLHQMPWRQCEGKKGLDKQFPERAVAHVEDNIKLK